MHTSTVCSLPKKHLFCRCFAKMKHIVSINTTAKSTTTLMNCVEHNRESCGGQSTFPEIQFLPKNVFQGAFMDENHLWIRSELIMR
jgi:hypothetical protein